MNRAERRARKANRRRRHCKARTTRKAEIRELREQLANAALLLMQERALTGRLRQALSGCLRRAARAEVAGAGCRCHGRAWKASHGPN